MAGILRRAEDTNDPSEWLHPMVVTRKKDPSKCRITVDLRDLNKGTVRPVFMSLTPYHVVSTVPTSAKFFTVLDGLKGFHQVELAEESNPPRPHAVREDGDGLVRCKRCLQ